MEEPRLVAFLFLLGLIVLILIGVVLQNIYLYISAKKKKTKYEIDISDSARKKRREKAEKIISGDLKLEAEELLDFIAEMLLDCKYDADSGADDTVKQKNAEILEKLFSIEAKN